MQADTPASDREPEQPPEQPSLRAVVPPSAPEPEPEPAPAPEKSVVGLSSRRRPEPREWNLWELESLARGRARVDPERREEWSYLFVHLRQFADAEGTLPSEFDALVRESFGDILET